MWSLDNKRIRMQADSMEYRNNIDQTSLISFAIFATFLVDVGLNVTRFFKNDRMLSDRKYQCWKHLKQKEVDQMMWSQYKWMFRFVMEWIISEMYVYLLVPHIYPGACRARAGTRPARARSGPHRLCSTPDQSAVLELVGTLAWGPVDPESDFILK